VFLILACSWLVATLLCCKLDRMTSVCCCTEVAPGFTDCLPAPLEAAIAGSLLLRAVLLLEVLPLVKLLLLLPESDAALEATRDDLVTVPATTIFLLTGLPAVAAAAALLFW